jgi:hypothetical protein
MLLRPFTAITAVVGAVYCWLERVVVAKWASSRLKSFRFAKCDACRITLVGQVLHASSSPLHTYISSLSPILSYVVSKEALLWVRRAACSMGSCQFNKHHSTSITGETCGERQACRRLAPNILDYINAASKCLAASSYLQA